jgi:hypothetical protein
MSVYTNIGVYMNKYTHRPTNIYILIYINKTNMHKNTIHIYIYMNISIFIELWYGPPLNGALSPFLGVCV